ncbi:MAG: hypothetical protein ACPMAQ_03280 [Phycisphaerae bacterium]
MHTNPGPAAEKPPEGITNVTVILARVVWTLLGPAAIGLAALRIVTRGDGWLTPLDAFYAVVVMLMIACRAIEQRSGTATTVTGAPSTPDHFKRYVATLVIVAGAIWVGANLIGNHLLS